MGLSWQRARWTRVVPGRLGGAALLVPPILFFLPLGDFGLFDSWRQGSVAVASLGALMLAMGLGRDSATRDPTEFWIYQKGISLADWGITRWMLDAALALVVFVAWLVAWRLGAAIAGEVASMRVLAALLIWLVSIHLILTAILFAMGAMGSSRGTEVAIMLVLLAMLQPIILRLGPASLARIMDVLLPPLLTAVNVRVGIGAGESLRALLPSLLHVGTYVAVLLAVGSMFLVRRRPEES